MPQSLADVIWPDPGQKAQAEAQTERLRIAIASASNFLATATNGAMPNVGDEQALAAAIEVCAALAPFTGVPQATCLAMAWAPVLADHLRAIGALGRWPPTLRAGKLAEAVAATLQDVLAQLRPALEGVDLDLVALLATEGPDDQRMLAAQRLAATSFANPIPTQRWNANRAAIVRELGSRANDDGMSPENVMRAVTTTALIMAAHEAHEPRPHVLLRLGATGQEGRYPVEHLGGDVHTITELPWRHFLTWFRARVAEEALSDLVGNRTDGDAFTKATSLDHPGPSDDGDASLGVADLWAISDPAEAVIGNWAASDLVAMLGPDKADLVRLIGDGASATEAAQALGKSPDWAHQTLSRLRRRGREKFEKNSSM